VQHLPRRYRRVDALDVDGAEIGVFEQIADQSSRTGGDDDRIRLGQALQPRSQVRRFTDDGLLLGRAFAN
jgi:hypothetical protein